MNLKIDLTKSMSLATLRELDLNGDDLRDVVVNHTATASISPIGDEKRGFRRQAMSEDQTFLQFPIRRITLLGRGSSSRVYKSVRLTDLHAYAEKVLVLSSSTKRQQIMREIESLKALSTSTVRGNEHVVKLFDILQHPNDGTLSLLLEYMDGGTLQDIVSVGGCCDERILSSFAYQMLTGLHFLHSARIVHRDLKPSNVLINSSGIIKLSDLGLAKTMDVGQSLADSFVGTFEYMAPERLSGEVYSFASDIWSFGLTLHTVAIGKFPYSGKSGFFELLHATQSPQLPLPSHDYFSEHFISLITLCCANQFRDRPTSQELLRHSFLGNNNHVEMILDVDGIMEGKYSLEYKRSKVVCRREKKPTIHLESKCNDNPLELVNLLTEDWKKLINILYNQDATAFRQSIDGTRGALYVTKDVLAKLASDLDIKSDLIIEGFRKALKESKYVIGEMLRMMQQHEDHGEEPQYNYKSSQNQLRALNTNCSRISERSNTSSLEDKYNYSDIDNMNPVKSFAGEDFHKFKFVGAADDDEHYDDDFEMEA